MRYRLVVCALAVVVALVPATAAAHKGSPNYRSTVRSTTPAVAGVDIKVINYDDRLLMVNRSGRDVEVRGYDGEPYIRVLASYYLNLERFGGVQPPADASEKARPRWDVIDKTGRFEWHDHRIHYMSKSTPTQVKDEDERTKVFDWEIPIRVGGERVLVRGDLFWVPSPGGGLPRGALIGLAAVVIGGIAFVEVVRRRRRRVTPARRDPSRAW